MLSPYSNRLWSAEDQAFLANIAASLVSIVQRGQQVTSLQEKEQAAKKSLEEALAPTLPSKNAERTIVPPNGGGGQDPRQGFHRGR